MQSKRSIPAAIKFACIFVLILVFTSALVALDDSKAEVTHRRGESDVAYQARLRAAERRENSVQLIDKQPGETCEAYEARLRTTLKGYIYLFLDPHYAVQREGESQQSYQARCRAAERAMASIYYSLIVRPNEDEAAYRERLSAWKEAQLSISVERRRGESEGSYQARLRAAKRKKMSEFNSSQQ